MLRCSRSVKRNSVYRGGCCDDDHRARSNATAGPTPARTLPSATQETCGVQLQSKMLDLPGTPYGWRFTLTRFEPKGTPADTWDLNVQANRSVRAGGHKVSRRT